MVWVRVVPCIIEDVDVSDQVDTVVPEAPHLVVESDCGPLEHIIDDL